jgi:hypothetical protein
MSGKLATYADARHRWLQNSRARPCRPGYDRTTTQNKTLFDDISIVDRRQYPSHGYRAVHAIVRQQGKPVEIQIRTLLQHLWTELSEKLADVFRQAVKYGGGDERIKTMLAQASSMVAEQESDEAGLIQLHAESLSVETKLQTVQAPLPNSAKLATQQIAEQITQAEARLETTNQKMSNWFCEAIRRAEEMRGRDDLLD